MLFVNKMLCQLRNKTWCDVTVTSVSALRILICLCTDTVFQANPFLLENSLCSKNNIAADRLWPPSSLAVSLFSNLPENVCIFRDAWRRHHSCAPNCKACRPNVVWIARENADVVFVWTEWQGNNLEILSPSKHWSHCWISPRHLKLKMLLLHAGPGTRFQAY